MIEIEAPNASNEGSPLVEIASAASFLKRAGIITKAGELAPEYVDAPNAEVSRGAQAQAKTNDA